MIRRTKMKFTISIGITMAAVLIVIFSILPFLRRVSVYASKNMGPTQLLSATSTSGLQTQEVPGTADLDAAPVYTRGDAYELEGPNVVYNGVYFTLDPAFGSHLHAFNEAISLNGRMAHYIRFDQDSSGYCQTWCLMIFHVKEFEETLGSFVFPPAGYRGGAAVLFEAQQKSLSFQNGDGNRALEAFGQSHYMVSNESLKYVYRGYSEDKDYAVYVQFSTRAANLPDMAPSQSTNGNSLQDILNYNQQAAKTMDLLTLADFTPNLNMLDVMIESIHVMCQ